MHELSLAQNMLEIALEELGRHDCTTLTLLRVDVGALSGVVPESLEFGFRVLVKDTPHEGARLELNRIPLRLRCGGCGKEFDGGTEIGELTPCPECGEMLGHTVLTGKELRVSWLEGE